MADITKAKTFAVIDELGIDPLRDKSFDAIMGITNFKYHVIAAEEEHNMPLVAYNEYMNEEYWRVLMIFNGIADMFALKAGNRIKIPALALITTALNNVLTEQPTGSATVSI